MAMVCPMGGCKDKNMCMHDIIMAMIAVVVIALVTLKFVHAI